MTGILPFIKLNYLRILFLISTGLIIIGLPFSLAFMSIGSIGIALIYLLEGNYRNKFKLLISNKIALTVLALFFLHFLSLIWSVDASTGLKYALKILPLFSFPIVFSGIYCLKEKDKSSLLKLFLTTIIAAVLFYLIRNFYWLEVREKDPRNAIIFTSHIRLSLFIIFSAVSLQLVKIPFLLKLLIISIFGIFIWFIQSLTSLFVIITLAIALGFNLFQLEFKYINWLNKITLVIVVSVVSFFAYTVIDFYSVQNNGKAPEFTAAGNSYNRELENGFVENGNYLWSFICYKELEESWKKRTGKSIWEKSKSGYSYYSSLVRYLNNKGVTKDFEGVNQLSDKDVTRILNGNSYPDTWKFSGFSQRLRGMLFFLEKSKISDEFAGNSLSEKLVYQKMGLRLVKDHFIFGTGIGDFKHHLTEYFYKEYPEIDQRKIRYPHNQFLSILGRVGALGLLIILYLFYLLFTYKKNDEYFNLRRAFVIIVFCSFLTEDTIDTQAGVTFVAFVVGLIFIQNSSQNALDQV